MKRCKADQDGGSDEAHLSFFAEEIREAVGRLFDSSASLLACMDVTLLRKIVNCEIFS